MTSRQVNVGLPGPVVPGPPPIPNPVEVGVAGGINPTIPPVSGSGPVIPPSNIPRPSANFQPAVDDKEKAVKSGDEPLPMYTPPGFCAQTVYGCCSDGMIAKIDEFGSNCPRSRPTTTGGLSSLLAVRVINQLFPPRDPRPRVEEPGYR